MGLYLFLCGPSSALGQLTIVVHGGSSAARRLSVLSPLWVQHPPGAFSCSLVLYAHKTAVQGEVVSDGVLDWTESESSVNHQWTSQLRVGYDAAKINP